MANPIDRNRINPVVVPSSTEPTPRTNPSSAPSTSNARPDGAAAAAELNKIAPQQGAFRVGIAGRHVPNAAERALPGGSIAAAYGRAEEYGDIADAAASRVAANHPEIFGA